ncbi:iron-containing alcohol dehydrogenase [Stomatobaculum longum]|uniref:iron-containing alcohol dehydrogenase n=1 Tax=Stomatobaculum longum TaxID=796942 RepID=UPI0028EAB229|nr:iron-containing alcohol dehydrogenase [Stomatobaculum longum]
MQKFVYYAPTEIVFGRGEEARVAELVKRYGGSRVFVVYGGGSAVKSGLLGRVEETLRAAGIAFSASGGVVPNPLVSTARRMVEEARAFQADFILAVGGGSVIDTAKGVAHTVAAPGSDVWEFWTGRKVEASLPIGVILTISAAGSETSNSAVLTNDTLPQPTKRGITTDFNRPKFAILNPELTMTLPVWQIGAGAADIFMHTAERYFTPILGNHLSDEIAEGLLRDVVHFGPIAVKNPQDYEAMSELMWCGSVSHVGLTGIGSKGDTPRDGDWSCHQLGMALSAIGDYTHGATLTAVFPAWARYVKDANPSRFVRFAEKVYGIKEGTEEARIEAGIQATERFFKSLGMPVTLTELLSHTPEKKELEAFASECSYQKTRSIGGFKVLGYEDILNIYENAI